MTLLGLAAVLAVSIAGPLLALPRRIGLPVVVGELLVGVLLGRTGLGLVHPTDPVLSFLANAGFALVMMVAGTHVPLRDADLRPALGRGAMLATAVAVLAVPVGLAVARMSGQPHAALYAVLIASSSAALVMPVVDEIGLAGSPALRMVAQVAIADVGCIVALPLVIEPSRAVHAALGALAVVGAALVLLLLARYARSTGGLSDVHHLSVRRNFGLELRVSLVALFALAGLAVELDVSVLLAGFAAGLVLAALGEPRRLARQMFGLTEGFLGPVFFVWLGAEIDLRQLVSHPRMLLVAAGLAAGAVGVHALMRFAGQPLPLALLPAGQLGVPIGAAAIGERAHLLGPGEGGAILAAALVTVVVVSVAAKRAAPAGP